MTDVQHPFSDDRIAAVADERGVDETDLDSALAAVQDAISRTTGDDEYEYSSQHNYGWRDEEAYYLYGDGIWETLRGELSLSETVAEAAREVHRRKMVASAEERDERASVEEMLADGTEPLVVVDTASQPPLYGQDV
ncbi:hypothetical protein [Halorussus sp. MSC15.2]|uniref:hypothetical protein n=1 Tax=Halorussus sp. MSC15.2 TaxID=2283638 RepID=UPI0013D652E9|nr:hypothetical protein [Halorussus sp. MSC15.2]NEU58060.1 hypothetical protein [Halorussus sp. MSC15.2]